MTGQSDAAADAGASPPSDPLAGRVAHFAGLEPSSALFIDTTLPGYDEAGCRDVTLEQWDVCSVPPGVSRGFRNAGETSGRLLAIVGGTDAGRLTWAPEILEAARAQGSVLDEHGYMPGSDPAP